MLRAKNIAMTVFKNSDVMDNKLVFPQQNYQQVHVGPRSAVESVGIKVMKLKFTTPTNETQKPFQSIYASWRTLIYWSYLISNFEILDIVWSSHQKRNVRTLNTTFVVSNHTSYDTPIYRSQYK